MSIKNLDILFNPQRIAVIGASENDKSVGYHIFRNLIGKGFKGIVHPVHPRMRGVQGVEAYQSVRDIPHPIDLAMVATEPADVPSVLKDCGEKGVKGVAILAPDYKYRVKDAYLISGQIRKLASMHGCRILGPNSLGFLRPASNLNASLYPEMPPKGNIAFISESGLFSSAFLEHAISKNIGFSYFISLGSKLDVNLADMIDLLGRDGSTRAIFLHVQTINNGRRFMTAIRNFAQTKPIVAVKSGKSDAFSLLALTDCGSLAEEDLIYEAIFKRAGSLRVNSIVDLLNMAETIAKQNRPKGPRLLIVTNSTAPSEMAIDALKGMGGSLASPNQQTLQRISENLPLKQEIHNPLYLLTDTLPADYQMAIENCLKDPAIDGVLVICIPFPGIDLRKIAEAIVTATKRNPNTPLFTTWGGEKTAQRAIDYLNSKGIPTFYTPEQAVKSFMYMYRYDYNLQLLQETPEIIVKDFSPDLEKAEKIIKDCLSQKRFALHADEASELLRSFGIPVLETIRVDNAEEAVRASRKLGSPVVMKIDSSLARHNRQRTRIAVDLKDDRQIQQAFAIQNDLLLSLEDPEAGVTIQPMVAKSDYKLAVGAKKSMSFGTVILFGLGGEYLKAEKDFSIGLPPLNQTLARRMMEETKIYHYLHEMPFYRGALGYLEEMLVRFSHLLIALPQIGEININPLLLMENECVVRDVAIHLDNRLPKEYRWTKGDLCPLHLSIPPYPFKYEKYSLLKDGIEIFIRPIRGEDEPLLRRFFETLSTESAFYRFGQHRINMPHVNLARFCQVDYDRDLAFLAALPEEKNVIIGDVRLNRFADLDSAELSFVVADGWQGRGIGSTLMDYCLAVAREIGIKTLWMEIMKDNSRMIKFGQKYHFKRLPDDNGGDMVEMVLELK